MTLLDRIKKSGRRSDLIKHTGHKVHQGQDLKDISFVVRESTQIRKHIPAVIVVPGAGTLESIKLSSCKGGCCNGQRNRLVKSLLAGKTNPTFTSLIRMFVAITPVTFHTCPQRWVVTTMRYQIPDNHFALFSHVHLDIKVTL